MSDLIALLRSQARTVVRAADRPLRVWVDLAERLDLRVRLDGEHVVFEKLDLEDDTHVSKLEDPCFLIDFAEAVERAGAPATILCLGVGTGDELALLPGGITGVTGIDRDAAALAIARERFPHARFVEADLAQPLPVGRFDLVVAIAALQSTGLDDRELLRRIVQDHLTPDGGVIIAIPNCRYAGGERRFGARMKNFTQPELGLLFKDVVFYRKYLQQHAREVFVTGKNYILVTGVKRSTARQRSSIGISGL